ncbi:MAG: aminoacyl-tRNA hydrolase, partial [bacterium]|nr:aminoacyl-tRNA hydrolase [bacterium]
MKLIIGLGNPGKEYEKTRHNLGFMVVEKIEKDLVIEQLRTEDWEMKKKLKARVLKHQEIVLAEPQAFMNNSGFVVKSLIANYSITQLLNLWVIHDDLDLPLGKIR